MYYDKILRLTVGGMIVHCYWLAAAAVNLYHGINSWAVHESFTTCFTSHKRHDVQKHNIGNSSQRSYEFCNNIVVKMAKHFKILC